MFRFPNKKYQLNVIKIILYQFNRTIKDHPHEVLLVDKILSYYHVCFKILNGIFTFSNSFKTILNNFNWSVLFFNFLSDKISKYAGRIFVNSSKFLILLKLWFPKTFSEEISLLKYRRF